MHFTATSDSLGNENDNIKFDNTISLFAHNQETRICKRKLHNPAKGKRSPAKEHQYKRKHCDGNTHICKSEWTIMKIGVMLRSV